MTGKLGNVLHRLSWIAYWLGCILAIAIIVLGLFTILGIIPTPFTGLDVSREFTGTAIDAFLVWRIGRAFRYQETIDRSIDPRLQIALGFAIVALWPIFGECYQIFELPTYYPLKRLFCKGGLYDLVVFGIWYQWILKIGVVLVLRGVYRLFGERHAMAYQDGH